MLSRPAKKDQSMTIMLVDRNSVLVDTIHKWISSESKTATVKRAKHGGCAWRLIAKLGEVPDVMIVSVELPFMNGLTLTKKVRSSYPDVIVILTSARGEPINHEAHAFVEKPPLKKQLLGKIKELKKSSSKT